MFSPGLSPASLRPRYSAPAQPGVGAGVVAAVVGLGVVEVGAALV